MLLDVRKDNLLTEILDILEYNKSIEKLERQNERLMFEKYKETNDYDGFFNNEGYSRKYDCCLRQILRLFNIIHENED